MLLNFELSVEEAQIILNALRKEPYGVVELVIAKLQEQASKQMKKENK